MSNEITVRLKCSIEEINKILESKNFKIRDSYILDDTYYVPKEIDINSLPIREILNKAILLRQIEENFVDVLTTRKTQLTVKRKEFAQNGDIINQAKIDCAIINPEDGKKFLEAIGYIKLMNIRENDIEFANGDFEIQVKDVINGDNLLEIEVVENNEKYNTIDKLKNEINKLNIPIDTTSYFVKKAEIELEKILKL